MRVVSFSAGRNDAVVRRTTRSAVFFAPFLLRGTQTLLEYQRERLCSQHSLQRLSFLGTHRCMSDRVARFSPDPDRSFVMARVTIQALESSN